MSARALKFVTVDESRGRPTRKALRAIVGELREIFAEFYDEAEINFGSLGEAQIEIDLDDGFGKLPNSDEEPYSDEEPCESIVAPSQRGAIKLLSDKEANEVEFVQIALKAADISAPIKDIRSLFKERQNSK